MKILYLITKSNWGGAQRYVYDLATAFAAKDADCVVAFGGHGMLAENLEISGIPIRVIKSMQRDISLLREIFVFKEIYSLISKEKPDVLHVNSSKAAGIGALIGRLLGVKCIVVTIHGAPFREERNFFLKRLLYFFTWLTCLCAHKVITVSRQDESDIGAMFFIREKLSTVYLGLMYDPTIPTSVQKERKVHIVTVGELTRNKGYMYALQVMDKLKQKGLLFSYSIIGEGEDRKKLEEFISIKKLNDTVSLLGYQDARGELQKYDIYFLPSTKEGLPFVLLEAGKAMLPVVATITGGVPEIIRHEETGLLAQPKDVDELAKCLERLILDRKYAKTLGQALHSHVVQHFSYSKMLVETAKVYGLMDKTLNK